MRSWIEFLTAAGVCGTIALASTASFGQGFDPRATPYGIGAPTYDPNVAGYYGDAWPEWQYRGGPKSTSTTDYYRVPNVYYWGRDTGGMVVPR